jgi:hypothetical protein
MMTNRLLGPGPRSKRLGWPFSDSDGVLSSLLGTLYFLFFFRSNATVRAGQVTGNPDSNITAGDGTIISINEQKPPHQQNISLLC